MFHVSKICIEQYWNCTWNNKSSGVLLSPAKILSLVQPTHRMKIVGQYGKRHYEWCVPEEYLQNGPGLSESQWNWRLLRNDYSQLLHRSTGLHTARETNKFARRIPAVLFNILTANFWSGMSYHYKVQYLHLLVEHLLFISEPCQNPGSNRDKLWQTSLLCRMLAKKMMKYLFSGMLAPIYIIQRNRFV